MEIRYSYRDAPTIKAFAESNAFMRGLMGPFGSGKSSGCVVEIVRRALAQKPAPDGIRRTRWAVVRNTYGQLRDTTIKTFHQWLPPGDDKFGDWRATDFDYRITGFEGAEIEVMFRALDRPDHIRNLLSMELTGAWVNEAREVPWTIIDALQGRVGRFPRMADGGPTWHGIFMDTNPPDDLSGWYKYFEEARPDNAAIFKQPSGLSPQAENLRNLPGGQKYYENLASGKAEEYVKVYIRGEYGFFIDGKAVYSEYNDSVHCREVSPVKAKRIRRGWDFGLTPACTFSQLLPSGVWAVFDEIIAERSGIESFSEKVLAHCAQEYKGFKFDDFGDPAGTSASQTDEKSCFDILRGKNIEIEAGEQSLLRIESVRHPLKRMIDGQPGFALHPRCKILRRGFMGGYKYKLIKGTDERYHEEPDKNSFSHPHDALQYDASRLFADTVRGRVKPKWDALDYDNRGVV